MARVKKSDNKVIILLSLLFLSVLTIVYVVNSYPDYSLTGAKSPKGDTTGIGTPKGPHYNLNIIGVPKDKTADMTGSKGHRIFVKLEGKSKISLTEGDHYQVLDGNATDGKGTFQLPNPDPDNDGVTEYSVWARPLGKPGGSSKTTTCAVDTYGEVWCSTLSMVLIRDTGKSTFSDVSKQLLYVYADLYGNGVKRYPLFDTALQDYFWDYDNSGLKLVQLRFYEVISDVN